MPKFKKVPVVIEAHQWFENGDHPEDGPAVTEGEVVRYYRRPDKGGRHECQHCGHLMEDHGWIDTLEGGHKVCPGDWIITGVAGERYPCKGDIFQETYELVAKKSGEKTMTDTQPDAAWERRADREAAETRELLAWEEGLKVAEAAMKTAMAKLRRFRYHSAST